MKLHCVDRDGRITYTAITDANDDIFNKIFTEICEEEGEEVIREC